MASRIGLLVVLAVCLGCGHAFNKDGSADLVREIGDILNYDSPPTIVSAPKPEYPDFARDMGAEGKVLLKVLVLEDGKVGAVQVLESPHPILTGKAIDAVRQSLFAPATLAGQPVKATVVMPFVFRLGRTFSRTSVEEELSDPMAPGAVGTQDTRQPPEPPIHITK